MLKKKNLFGSAKEKKTTVKESVVVMIDDIDLSNKAVRAAQLKEKIDELAAERAELEGELKASMLEAYINNYDHTGKHTSSIDFAYSGSKDGLVTAKYIMQDRYKKIDEVGYDLLSSAYGDEIVEMNETYYFNPDVLERNQEAISDAIMSSKDISEADKENLLLVKTDYTVKKGTIKELKSKFSKWPLEELIAAINPIPQLKKLVLD